MPLVDHAGLKTHYALTGEGESVLILSNSLGTNFSMWDPQMRDMERRFRVLRYDTTLAGMDNLR
jgi:3-oxoadipate enol-lactonase